MLWTGAAQLAQLKFCWFGPAGAAGTRGGAGGETGGWPAGMGSTLRFERSRVLAHLLPLKRMLDGKGSEAASAACPHPRVLVAVRSARCRALL